VRRVVWLTFVACLSCGRTAPWDTSYAPWNPEPDASCAITLSATTLDLGSVVPGGRASAAVTIQSTGTATCTLDALSLAGSDPGFALADMAPRTLPPGAEATLEVEYVATSVEAPYDRAGKLTLRTTDPRRAQLSVDLKVHVLHCELRVATDPIDFGVAVPRTQVPREVTIENVGDLACALGPARIVGDPSFGVVAQASRVSGGSTATVVVRFFAEPVPPLERSATLVVVDDTGALVGEVPLVARLATCVLTATPDPLAFGNVPLNTSTTRTLVLRNVGSAPCAASNFRLGRGTDPLYSLPAPPRRLELAIGGTARLDVAFDGRDAAPPHLRTGTLLFDTDDLVMPARAVPLTAFINTICDERGQFIYTVDVSGAFSRFDPLTLTSTLLGQLRCPTMSGATPFSMNVDQSANAWVLFSDGALFQVDTGNAACRATPYVPGQLGITTYGMGSVFDTSTGVDTLFIAGIAGAIDAQATLGTLDLTRFQAAALGTMDVGSVELAGTGDGQLWAFAPPRQPDEAALLDRVDLQTGRSIEHHEVFGITTREGSFATKFWGGAFYLFIGPDVWRLPRDALVADQLEPTEPPTLVFSAPGASVVGAGVSTCAPVGR
jgi:hypothetical protein